MRSLHEVIQRAHAECELLQRSPLTGRKSSSAPSEQPKAMQMHEANDHHDPGEGDAGECSCRSTALASRSFFVVVSGFGDVPPYPGLLPVSYTHLRAHETDSYLVCRLLLE